MTFWQETLTFCGGLRYAKSSKNWEADNSAEGSANNMCHKNNKWMCVAIVAAVVAALTTVAVFLLRARAKRKALRAYNR